MFYYPYSIYCTCLRNIKKALHTYHEVAGKMIFQGLSQILMRIFHRQMAITRDVNIPSRIAWTQQKHVGIRFLHSKMEVNVLVLIT